MSASPRIATAKADIRKRPCPLYPRKETCRYIFYAAITIASLRPHGVRRLLVYCNGKREGDWPCHHRGTLQIEQFSADEALRDIERVADALPADGDERI